MRPKGSPWAISHYSPIPRRRPQQTFPFLKPGDVPREIHYHYSLTPSAVYPWDPVVLRGVWEMDPDLIPAQVTKIWRSPAGADLAFFYFALLRFEPFLLDAPIEFTCPGGRGVWHRGQWVVPNMEEILLEDDPPQQGLPGAFIPCDGDMLIRVRRAIYLSRLEREAKAKQKYQGTQQLSPLISAQDESKQKAEAALWAESDARWDDEWPTFLGNAQKVSSSDLSQPISQVREPQPYVVHDKRRQFGAKESAA